MELNNSRTRKARTAGAIISIGIFLGLFYAFLSDGLGNIFPYVNTAIIGLLVGLLISYIELYIFTLDEFRKLKFMPIVLIRTGLYVILITFIIFFELVIARMIKYDLSFHGVWISEEFQTYMFEKDFLIAIIYTIAIAFCINFTLQISRKMGQGVLWGVVTGRYYDPVQQERIFMFINIKYSSQIVKKLGPLNFHKLLNDFIFDITEPILAYQGVIYQYVEDVLVVSWNTKQGLLNGNCIRAFFDAKQRIWKMREKYYLKYDLVPQFQAAYHCGSVIQGEIGTEKSEITFMGDVMNTTSRILTQCEVMNTELLVSAQLMNRLVLPVIYVSESCGEVKLKGKRKLLGMFTVKEIDTHKQFWPDKIL
jgi:adenylate cyclase